MRRFVSHSYRYWSRMLPVAAVGLFGPALLGSAFLGAMTLLVGGCATSGDAPTAARTEEVVLFVEMETSSDWTNLIIGEEREIVRGMVTCYARGCKPYINPEWLSAVQPLSEAEAGERVFLEAIVHVALPTRGEFPVWIERGHIGETTVRFFRLDGQVATPLGEVTWAGINEATAKNVQAFTLPVSGDPVPELPYRPENLEASWEQWRKVMFEFSGDWEGLYWPGAEYRTLAVVDDVFEVEPATEHIRNHLESGPLPNVDYELISFTPIIHVPSVRADVAKLISYELYDGEIFSANTLHFREKDGEWRISSQTWKIGYEMP